MKKLSLQKRLEICKKNKEPDCDDSCELGRSKQCLCMACTINDCYTCRGASNFKPV